MKRHTFRPDGMRPTRMPTDDEMPVGMTSQPEMGDLKEQERAVTAGFETMHLRIPGPPPRDCHGDVDCRVEDIGAAADGVGRDLDVDGLLGMEKADAGRVDLDIDLGDL